MFSGIFLFKPYDTDSVVLSHKGGKYGKIFVLNYALKNGIKAWHHHLRGRSHRDDVYEGFFKYKIPLLSVIPVYDAT